MTTCQYCDLPHSGDRCPTMAGQMARLRDTWGRLLAEARRPFEPAITRVRDDTDLQRILWVGMFVAMVLLVAAFGPRVLAPMAMAIVAGLYLGRRRVGQ